MEISIIITVYNKAPYLPACLDSCLGQKAPEGSFEVIAVNDGSTDNSLELLQQRAAADSRLRVMDQPNAGLSMARNKGMEAACGRYVWFVDADDRIAEDAVRLLLEHTASHPDVVSLCAQTEGVAEVRNAFPMKACSGKTLLIGNSFEDCAPFYLLRLDFLRKQGLSFYPGICHEDAEFTPRMLYLAERVEICPEVLYIVWPDPNSLGRHPVVKRAYDLVTVAASLSDFCRREVSEAEVAAVFAFRIAKALNNGLHVICGFSREEQRAYNGFLYRHRRLFRAMGGLVKYRLERALFRLFPRHAVAVYRCMKGGRV